MHRFTRLPAAVTLVAAAPVQSGQPQEWEGGAIDSDIDQPQGQLRS